MKYLVLGLVIILVTYLFINSFNEEIVYTEEVNINQGSLTGYAKDETNFYLGIPYAQAPIGDLRWKPPLKHKGWKEKLLAVDLPKSCMQPTGFGLGPFIGLWIDGSGMSWFSRKLIYFGSGLLPFFDGGEDGQSEDCLYLNIMTPKQKEEKLPVMLWIHGGGYRFGNGAGAYINTDLPSKDVVLVTINYRLGSLGYFAHPTLSDESEFNSSGNYGTLDQIQALKWVQENIENFGGDPSNVTIFGESAGGHAVRQLMSSPLSIDLFHKAIAQSGSTKTSSLSESINYFDNNLQPGNKNSSKELFNQLLIADGMAEDRQSAIIVQDTLSNKEQYDFLIDRTTEEIIQTYYNNLDNKDYMHQVINDGYVIPENGMDFQNTQKLKDIPVIMGTNRDEMKLFLAFDPEFASQRFSLTFIKDQDFYDISSEYGSMGWKVAAVDKPATELVSLGNKNIFGYRFDWDEEPKVLLMDLSRILGAAHAIEIPFVMGGMKLGGLEDYMFDKKNIKTATQLSKSMMSYWSEFAYNGDPGKGRNAEQIKWHAWDNNNQQEKFIILDTKADGGIRMSLEAMSYASLVEGLLLDPRIPNDQMRCEFLYKAIDANWVIDERIINSGLCNVN